MVDQPRNQGCQCKLFLMFPLLPNLTLSMAPPHLQRTLHKSQTPTAPPHTSINPPSQTHLHPNVKELSVLIVWTPKLVFVIHSWTSGWTVWLVCVVARQKQESPAQLLLYPGTTGECTKTWNSGVMPPPVTAVLDVVIDCQGNAFRNTGFLL